MRMRTPTPYAAVPTLFDRVQDELSAIQEITQVLGALPDHQTRVRVIGWINERFARAFEGPPAPARPAVAFVAPDDYALADGAALKIPDADDLFEPAGQAVEAPDLVGVFDPPAAPAFLHDVFADTQAAERLKDAVALVAPVEASTPAEPAADTDEGLAGSIDQPPLGFLAVAPIEPAAAELRDEPAPESIAPTAHRAAAPAAKSESNPAPAEESMEALLRSLVADFRQLAGEWGNT